MSPISILAKGLKAASWYVIIAGALQLLVEANTFAVTRTTSHETTREILLNPLTALKAIPNPYSGLTANTTVLWLCYAETILAGGALVWIALIRHGYGNPLNLLRPEHELPLARQLTPKLRDLGLWIPHDAARNDPRASIVEKVKVAVVRTLRPNADLSRAMTKRANGILVPYEGPQPASRIFLGHYRHMHLLKKRKYNVYARPEQHVVIFGPSGAGKGATQMNPTLLFWNGERAQSPDGHGKGWPGAVITSTVKSDHVDTALEWRLSLSDQCYVYDPLQMYPEYRKFWVGWNPLSTVTNFSEAAAVAAALMESESQQGGASSGNEDYFKAQALMVLGPMILSAALAKQPFRAVYDWSLRIESEVTDPAVVSENGDVAPGSKMYAALEPLIEYAEATGDETPLNQMQQVFSKDPREASGVWGSVRKVLQPYNDEKSVLSTDGDKMPRMFNPRDFYSTPHATLFIVAPEVANEARRMRPVFAAFITWLIEEAQKLAREKNGKLPYPVLANLDEVKNVGAIPGLAHTLSLTRSIGFFVKHAWQDEAQIASAYGKDDAKTITSNSRTWVILPGISDPDHLEALSRLIGERPVKRRKAKATEERDRKDQMRSASASMVKEIKDDELLILTDNLPPFVIKATRYFQDKIMNERYKLGDHRRATGEMPEVRAMSVTQPMEAHSRPPEYQTSGRGPDSPAPAAVLPTFAARPESTKTQQPDQASLEAGSDDLLETMLARLREHAAPSADGGALQVKETGNRPTPPWEATPWETAPPATAADDAPPQDPFYQPDPLREQLPWETSFPSEGHGSSRDEQHSQAAIPSAHRSSEAPQDGAAEPAAAQGAAGAAGSSTQGDESTEAPEAPPIEQRSNEPRDTATPTLGELLLAPAAPAAEDLTQTEGSLPAEDDRSRDRDETPDPSVSLGALFGMPPDPESTEHADQPPNRHPEEEAVDTETLSLDETSAPTSPTLNLGAPPVNPLPQGWQTAK